MINSDSFTHQKQPAANLNTVALHSAATHKLENGADKGCSAMPRSSRLRIYSAGKDGGAREYAPARA
jgi:hypothetical protein